MGKSLKVGFISSPLKRPSLPKVREVPVPPVFPRSFKNSGLRRILRHVTMMETEALTLKRKYLELRRSYKEIKRELREQRDKTRNIINICGDKLLAKENEALQCRKAVDQELAKVARDLLLLHSNMLKEQKVLQSRIESQESQLRSQQSIITQYKKEIEESTSSSSSSSSSSLDSSLDSETRKLPPVLPPRRNDGLKPPIPSRASVNRKLHIKDGAGVSGVEEEDSVPGDEGFCSSHEDTHSSTTQSRKLSVVFEDSSLWKSRGCSYKSISTLEASEEHQIISNSFCSPVTTVTYIDYF